MTTVRLCELKCSVCEQTSRHTVVGSTNALGSPDLDTRPPEMKRSTIQYQVHACPSCGYCSGDISEVSIGASEIVRTEAYQAQLRSPSHPELASKFLCWSMIEEQSGHLTAATWTCLHAAWACDDASSDTGAQGCRLRAAELLRKARAAGQTVVRNLGVEEAILTDLLRRSGLFEEALSLCGDGLAKRPEETIERMLEYQKVLIEGRDTRGHTIEEAHRR